LKRLKRFLKADVDCTVVIAVVVIVVIVVVIVVDNIKCAASREAFQMEAKSNLKLVDDYQQQIDS